MGPIFPISDIVDAGVIDPVIFRNVGGRPWIIVYVEHLIFRQLCATISRPFTCSAADDPIQDVIVMGARLQMPRVHAERIIAAMTNYEPFRDPAVKVFIAKAMSGEIAGANGE